VVPVVAADVFEPAQVLGHEDVRDLLDLAEPLALLQVGTLHHHTATTRAELMQEYVDALRPAAGWWSRTSSTRAPRGSARWRGAWSRCSCTARCARGSSGPEQIAAFLPGLEIIPPGPAGPGSWSCATCGGRRSPPATAEPGAAVHRRAVARKP
jgi:hypothetical protein